MRFLVVMCDTLRRDHLGCYGNPWIRTPHFDRLAEQATVFDRAYIASFPTIPNRTDLFTGKFTFPFKGWAPLDRAEPTLAGALGGAGHVTQIVHDTMHLVNNGNFFARGFQGWDAVRGGESDPLETLANVPIQLPCPDDEYRDNGRAAKQYLRNRHFWTTESDWFVARTSARACQWLERNYKARDFLLWLDTFEIHEPWDPPQWYVDLYDPGYTGKVNIHPRYDYCDYLSPRELRQVRARYAGEVTLVDTWIGRVLEKLELLGIFDETLVVLTSDHGMYLGDHGRIGKHTVVDDADPWPLYDVEARIPLVVKTPGQRKSRRTQAMVQPPDLMPTLLDLAGTPTPAGRHGLSIAPIQTGKARRHRTHVFCGGGLRREGRFDTPITVTRDDGWTLVFGHPTNPPELYDLKADPQQKRSVLRRNRLIAEGLREEFARFLGTLGVPIEAPSL